jgi:transcriptional regulator
MNSQREVIDRRVKVAQLRLAGVHDQAQIARQLGVSQPTISRDFAALDAQFRATAAQDIAAAKGMDLHRLELLISKIWVKATNGDLYAIDRLDKLLARRAKLLGLDAPTTVRIIQDEAEKIAAEFGLTVADVLAEAEAIVQGAQV